MYARNGNRTKPFPEFQALGFEGSLPQVDWAQTTMVSAENVIIGERLRRLHT